MNLKSKVGMWFVVLCACLVSVPALAEEDASSEDVSEEDESSHGFNVDVGWASAYVFRGLNVFQENDQSDQHGALFTAASWNIFGSGLTLGYFGAYQLNGGNISDNIDKGLGAEQDIYLSYEWALMDIVGLHGGLYYYFYPGATSEAAGTEAPMYLEPFMGATLSVFFDIGMDVNYFRGLQDAVRPNSYVYLNPTVSKEHSLLPIFKLFYGVGYGYKIWHDDYVGESNTHDVQLDLGATVDLFDTLYVTPAVHAAWTNIDGADNAFTDGLVFWGGINAGLNL